MREQNPEIPTPEIPTAEIPTAEIPTAEISSLGGNIVFMRLVCK